MPDQTDAKQSTELILAPKINAILEPEINVNLEPAESEENLTRNYVAIDS